MSKEITYKQFMRAMWRRTKADLIVSKYNLQEAKKFALDVREHGITCRCNEPLTYGVLSKKCYRCNHPLKK